MSIAKHLLMILLLVWSGAAPATEPWQLDLAEPTRQRCLEILRAALDSEAFWVSIHAAEGLTLSGHGSEVLQRFLPRLKKETDDQRRCGLARELVRAGDVSQRQVLLSILEQQDDYAHVHAAESLYKISSIGNGIALRRAFQQTENQPLQIMAAAALARCGNPKAKQQLRQWLASGDEEASRLAAWVLGRVGSKADIPQLQRNVARTTDPTYRSDAQHALAALGDASGLTALRHNLASRNPAIRTAAAAFAGDARDLETAPQLINMLEDPHEDARVRAAQSLLVLSQLPIQRDEDISNLPFPATEQHPRHTEGSVLELNDGSLLLAATEFLGEASDFSQAHIVARRSTDGGRTWQPPRELQKNIGGLNVMSVTLRRLEAPATRGAVAMFFLVKNSPDNLKCFVRFSRDETKTFGPAVCVTDAPGYHVVNNDRVVQLSGGRILVPVAYSSDVQKEDHFVSFCYYSDDGGKSWRKGRGHVDQLQRGAMEPEVIELNDGRCLMIVRTQLGIIAASVSEDRGDTWSEPYSLGVTAPEAPATIRRIPSTGDLLLIYNPTFVPGAGLGGPRTPLAAAISTDESKTWLRATDLEARNDRSYAYTSVAFVRDRVVLSYWDSDLTDMPDKRSYSLRFRSLPVAKIYESQ